jgi:PAS domain S-box-containing protein
VEHVLNITLDVSAQVAAEEKIAEQELFIQHIADASPTILYIFDVANNCFQYVNKEIFFVLGYSTGEVEGMGSEVVANLYHPEDLPLLPERRESSKHFQHTTSMIQYECRMRSKEDEWKWLLVREVVFKADEGGKPLQILGAALDISKRKEMERSLLQNSFQLEQSNASLEEFAYVASHDLKEPLRKISTFGDRLVTTQAERLSDDGKLYLNKIVDASQRMQHMINDLLSISLISGDRSFQPFSLQAVLDDAQQALEYKIEKRGAVITADPLPEVNIVASQFRQLFQNLLSNSLKFTPPERTPEISITAQFLSPEEVSEFQIVQAPQYLKLEFKDNGIGFESEYAGKIFQIFQRLHGKSEYEGTGIGLAICKKIVEHHRGIIYAAGALNEGSTFTIILPA